MAAKKIQGRQETSKRRLARRSKRKMDWSKIISLLSILAGFTIVQECLFLMYLCIKSGYMAAAAWLTAATSIGQAVIITGIGGYLGLAKSDHRTGGITYEAAAASGFHLPEETEI